MNRNQFLKTGILSTGALVATPLVLMAQQESPQLDKKLVQEFVGKSHGDGDRVKELLDEHPTLLNAAHDWKYGDFETGLGAASHMGNKELVKYFLDKGAQANIFTAALFGRMEIIRPLLDFSPATAHAKGPHGLTLLHHALKGGDEALEVKEYLTSLGVKETQIALY